MRLLELEKAIQKEPSVELLDKTKETLFVYDHDNSMEICFTDEDSISEEWLENKIWINQKLVHRFNFNKDNIAKVLMQMFAKEELQTLKQIYVIYQKKDFDYIAKKNDEELPEIDSFWINQVGLMWFSHQTIFINMNEIEKFARKFALSWSEFEDEITSGFWITLFHELRHLTLDTHIFLSEDKYPIEESSEIKVEHFGIDTFKQLSYSDLNYEIRTIQAIF